MHRAFFLLELLVVLMGTAACQAREAVNDPADPPAPPSSAPSEKRPPTTAASVGHVQHARCAQPSGVTLATVPPTSSVRRLPALVSVRRSGVAAPVRCVVKSHAELDSVRVRFGHALDEVPLDVDFERNLLVVAAMGEQMNDNYWISVDTAWVTSDTTYVVVRSLGPSDVEIVRDLVSSPLVAVLVPRARTVSFLERE